LVFQKKKLKALVVLPSHTASSITNPREVWVWPPENVSKRVSSALQRTNLREAEPRGLGLAPEKGLT
jgi:hypothetical protein